MSERACFPSKYIHNHFQQEKCRLFLIIDFKHRNAHINSNSLSTSSSLSTESQPNGYAYLYRCIVDDVNSSAKINGTDVGWYLVLVCLFFNSYCCCLHYYIYDYMLINPRRQINEQKIETTKIQKKKTNNHKIVRLQQLPQLLSARKSFEPILFQYFCHDESQTEKKRYDKNQTNSRKDKKKTNKYERIL